jgi:hypothetical protein
VVEWAARELANETRPDRQRRIAAMVADYLADPGPLSDAECARFALLVTDLEVRDTAWSMMSRQRALDHTELWQQVVSRTVSPLERGPLGLLGMAGWLSGNGTLMVCCIERLSRIDPGYTMGSLLDDINQRALSPEVWDSMAESLRAAVA